MAILEGGHVITQNRPMTSAEIARLRRPRQPNGLTRSAVGTPAAGSFARHPAYPQGGTIPTPTYTPPAPQPATNYDALFRASIDSQRGQIDAQLRSAMAALAQRETQANALVARQPGEVNANYAQAEPALANLRKTAEDAQGQLHVQSLDQPGAAMNPIIAAIAGDKAARLSDQPYLQAGTGEIFTRQKGALNQAGMAAKSDLESRMSDYLQQNAMQDRQDAAAKEANKPENDPFYAHTQFAHDLNAKDARAAARAKQQEEQRLFAREGAQGEPAKGSARWWEWYQKYHPNQAQSYLSAHGNEFANAQRLMQMGEWVAPYAYGLSKSSQLTVGNTHREKLSMKEINQRFKGPRYARLRAALRFQKQAR